ncbi:MAG: response regulator transcription factor [Spirochaetia bacterium]
MKHLFFLYWISSLMTGFAALTFLVTIMIRERTAKPLPYTVLVSNFTLLIMVNIFASYHHTNIDGSIETLRVYLVLISILMSYTIFTAPYFLLTLYAVPHLKRWIPAFFVYASSGAAGHLMFFGSPWLMVFNASIPVLFLLIFAFIRKREPVMVGIKPFLSIMKAALIIYIPFYLIIDLNFLVDMELFSVYSDENLLYFGVLPLFYGFWSILYLLFEIRRGIFSVQRKQESEQPERDISAFGEEYGLSRREMEILRCIIDGASRKETAEKLCIAEGTVKKHVQNVFNKTGCHSRLELMALIYRKPTPLLEKAEA